MSKRMNEDMWGDIIDDKLSIRAYIELSAHLEELLGAEQNNSDHKIRVLKMKIRLMKKKLNIK